MPQVLIYVSLFLVLAIVCASNKCMQLYTYVSTIWCYMEIGQLGDVLVWHLVSFCTIHYNVLIACLCLFLLPGICEFQTT